MVEKAVETLKKIEFQKNMSFIFKSISCIIINLPQRGLILKFSAIQWRKYMFHGSDIR